MPRSLEFRAAAPADLERVQKFLCSVFQLAAPTRVLQHDALRWKYFDPHPFWEGSRSYILESGDVIAAHGCVVPVRFLTASGAVSNCCVIDWAAGGGFPGAGALLYQRLYSKSETMLGIGGSDAARKVLPRMGFQDRASLERFARVNRPWKLFREGERGGWKPAAHLGRNLARLMRPIAGVPEGWSARRVERFDAAIDPVLPRAETTGAPVCERSAALLNYALACPAAAMTGFLIERDKAVAGYGILSRVARECRIADLWIASSNPGDWQAGFALAARLAHEDRGISSVLALVSDEPGRAAVSRAGFSARERMPVFVRDPKALLNAAEGLRIGPLENDFFYL